MTLIGGFALKAQCLGGFDGRQYSRLCYNDLQPLYSARSIDERTFPYLDGRLVDGELVGGAIEYPVLTGVFMWAAGLLVDDANAYLVVSALLLAPFALVTAFLLARMAGLRALLWSAAPALVLYAFHNWDLLVVAAAVAGLWLWSRGRMVAAAVVFGAGAAFKLYPAFFLAPLVLESLAQGRRDRAGRIVVAGAGVFAAINLPFALLGGSGWLATYAFHSARGPNYDNMWQLAFPSDVVIELPALAPGVLNLVTAILTGVSFVVALAVGWSRTRGNDSYPVLPVCGALVAAFLLWNKVHSPQYTLWLLPFFVLLRVHLGWWFVYSFVDLVVYVGVFRWFYDFVYLGRDFTLAKQAMITGVWGRAFLLVALFVVFLRSRAVTPVTANHADTAQTRRFRHTRDLASDEPATAPDTEGARQGGASMSCQPASCG